MIQLKPMTYHFDHCDFKIYFMQKNLKIKVLKLHFHL